MSNDLPVVGWYTSHNSFDSYCRWYNGVVLFSNSLPGYWLPLTPFFWHQTQAVHDEIGKGERKGLNA